MNEIDLQLARKKLRAKAPMEGSGVTELGLDAMAEVAPARKNFRAALANARAAFVLTTVYGHSVEEIATIMKAARSTTRLRLDYGRKKFRAALAKRATTEGEPA